MTNTIDKPKTKKYNVLSPDGFPIEFNTTYRSIKKAREAGLRFIERYKIQGYYSSNRGRISLEDLPDELQLITL